MIKTGLTKQELESLLKAILCECKVEQQYDEATNRKSIILDFNKHIDSGKVVFSEPFTYELGKLVLKAMHNIQMSAFGFNERNN